MKVGTALRRTASERQFWNRSDCRHRPDDAVLPRRDRAKRTVSKTPEEGRSAVKNDTPRTNAAESNWWSEDGLRSAFIVRADFARELEREMNQLRKERDEARRYSCDLEARITMLEEDRRDTSNNFGTNPCSEIILPDYPLARDSKEIAKRKGWDCYKEETK